MISEIIVKKEVWASLASLLPIATAFWACIKYIYGFLKNGKLIKLRYFYKEYGEHLDDEDKKYISKLLKEKVMRQVVPVPSGANRTKMVYILNRCDLTLSLRKIAILSRYLKFDGKRFYFLVDTKYLLKRKAAWFAGVVYLAYALAPIKFYHEVFFGFMSTNIAYLFSLLCVCMAIFLFNAYPSKEQIQGANGRMLKLNVLDYEKHCKKSMQ